MRDYKSMNVEIGLFVLPYCVGAFAIKVPISPAWNALCAVVAVLSMAAFCAGMEWVKRRAADANKKGGAP